MPGLQPPAFINVICSLFTLILLFMLLSTCLAKKQELSVSALSVGCG